MRQKLHLNTAPNDTLSSFNSDRRDTKYLFIARNPWVVSHTFTGCDKTVNKMKLFKRPLSHFYSTLFEPPPGSSISLIHHRKRGYDVK